MRIGFDIDGVLADFNTSFIELVKDVTGRDLFGPGFWPATWNYPEAVGYTADECSASWQAIKDGGNFWRNLNPLADMKTLRQWLWTAEPSTGSFHEFYFITSRMGKNVKLQTEEWLDEHSEMPGLTVLISSEKGALCKALKLDYYVDDRAENIIDVQQTSPNTRAFLIQQPWNQHLPVYIRAQGITEFLTAIDYYSLPAVA